MTFLNVDNGPIKIPLMVSSDKVGFSPAKI